MSNVEAGKWPLSSLLLMLPLVAASTENGSAASTIDNLVGEAKGLSGKLCLVLQACFTNRSKQILYAGNIIEQMNR